MTKTVITSINELNPGLKSNNVMKTENKKSRNEPFILRILDLSFTTECTFIKVKVVDCYLSWDVGGFEGEKVVKKSCCCRLQVRPT